MEAEVADNPRRLPREHRTICPRLRKIVLLTGGSAKTISANVITLAAAGRSQPVPLAAANQQSDQVAEADGIIRRSWSCDMAPQRRAFAARHARRSTPE